MIIDLGNNLEALLAKLESPQRKLESRWKSPSDFRYYQRPERLRSEFHGLRQNFWNGFLKWKFLKFMMIRSSLIRRSGTVTGAKIAVASNEKMFIWSARALGWKAHGCNLSSKNCAVKKLILLNGRMSLQFCGKRSEPAKVSQVRITDINRRKMEVIVTEDQLSLAIGKRGQNVRLATDWLVGILTWRMKPIWEKKLLNKWAKWWLRVRSVSALEGVSAAQADDLKQKGITDVETLAVTSIDDLVESWHQFWWSRKKLS